MNTRTLTIAVIVLALGIAAGYYFGLGTDVDGGNGGNGQATSTPVTNFEECVAAGNPVMESYPRQCRSNDEVFVEFIGNEIEKRDLIRLETPRPNDALSSPLEIRGEARGTWYFEATFPIQLTNWDGLIIGEGHATAQDEWMTEDFVPFTAEITFEDPYQEGDPDFMRRGSLILQKSNPSGLPENDDALEIPVRFE